MNKFNDYFQTFTLGSWSTENRVVMAPMTRNFSKNNIPGEDVAEYYRRRAAGNVGLIITEGTCIDHIASNGYDDVPFMYGDQSLAGWKRVVDSVHKESGTIFSQLWHVGSYRDEASVPASSVPGYSPSGLLAPDKKNGRTMTHEDIENVVCAYADAALNAKKVGFDGIEIHAAHGYLIDQFFWAGTNQRNDRYGGSMQNRLRFAIEVVKAIRAAVGEDFPISLRWSQWKQQDYKAHLCATPNELEDFLTPLADAGVDIFHCSTRYFWIPEFEKSNLSLAGWAKKLTGKATIAVGNIGLDYTDKNGVTQTTKESILDDVHERLGNNEFDLAAIGRALIVNPDLVKHLQNNNVDTLKPFMGKALKSLA